VKRLLVDVLRRTAVGSALICLGVPMLQGQVMTLSQERRAGPELHVTGDVTGLEPGHPGSLLLTVANDGDVAATIHQITTAVMSSVGGCSLSVATWRGTANVAAGGAVTRSVTVRVVGPRCVGASWKLAYNVS
jgi:hypothetical protein